MLNYIKRNLFSLLASMVYWIIASYVFYAVRYYGTQLTIDWASSRLEYVLMATIGGVIFGIVSWFSSTMIDHSILRKRSYAFLLSIKLMVMLMCMTLMIFCSRLFAVYTGTISIDQLFSTLWEITGSNMIVGICYLTAVGTSFGLIKQFVYRLGPQVFYDLLKGKFYHPKVEERIFMFLDLRSSTVYAEKLGHIEYSKLIQDCFYDLTDSAIKHEVEIYQYIGDEAVLTWKTHIGLNDCNCLRVFFEFQHTIEKRKNHYLEKYGFVPEFKAGANIGQVTVAQVGVLRREIAYHSDVLNVAAAIQGQCNVLNEYFLISGHLRDRLNVVNGFKFASKGKIPLKGKSIDVELFSVDF